ncbi:MAG: carboxylesterase family protein, partial [Bradyrhizobium sp.]
MKRTNWRLACAAVLLGALVVSANAAGLEVGIDSGPITGKFQRNTAVRAFLGIPFAAPPVGDLRWKPPQPVAAWQAPRPAMSYGAQCMQPGR